MAFKYKWKPNATQKREFAQRMQDPTEAAAYEDRKKAKRLYENWKYKDFVPTKEQYDFCFENMDKVKAEQQEAFNQVD